MVEPDPSVLLVPPRHLRTRRRILLRTTPAAGSARVRRTRLPHGDVLLVGASRGAVDDLARSIAAHRRDDRPASLQPDAARRAAGRADPGGRGTRARDGARVRGGRRRARRSRRSARARCSYFAPVARTPGFPRALARTLQELRLAHVDARSPRALPLGGAISRRCSSASTSSSPRRRHRSRPLVRRRHRALDDARRRRRPQPLLLLDVPLDSAAEFDFVRALIAAHTRRRHPVRRPRHRAVRRHRARWIDSSARPQRRGARTEGGQRPRRAAPLPVRQRRSRRSASHAGDVQLLLRAGRRTRSVEIARRILQEARARRAVRRDGGVRARAAAVRRPARARADARRRCRHWFDRGTRRPHPGGPRLPRHPRLRVREALGAPLRRVSLARPGAATGRVAARPRVRRARRRGCCRSARASAECSTTSAAANRRRPRPARSAPTRTRTRSSPARCGRRGSGKR